RFGTTTRSVQATRLVRTVRSVRDRQQDAVTGTGVDAVVGLRYVLQGQRRADRDRQRTVPGRGGEVRCCLLLSYVRKVVATKETDGHVVEQQGPEREGGPVLTGGVGGDDRLV